MNKKLYIHHETGNIYQIHDGNVWAHPLNEGDQLLNLDTDADMEWAALDPYGDDVTLDGKEISQTEFENYIRAKFV